MSSSSSGREPHAPNDAESIYVAYLPPSRTVVKLAIAAAGLLVVSMAGLGFIRGFAQGDPGPAEWRDLSIVKHTGVIRLKPYPHLVVPSSGTTQARSILIVEAGKIGAQERLRAHDGKVVSLSGTELQRDDVLMLELESAPAGISASSESTSVVDTKSLSLGIQSLRGEIVDSKCFLGAMKPGDGKTHKACATLCVRGGIPPGFTGRDEKGSPIFCIVQSTTGDAVGDWLLPFVADPVEVRGELWRRDGLLYLSIAPSDVRRLSH